MPEPEIWFRILHVNMDGVATSAATFREQSVEIALGPKPTFQKVNISTATRTSVPPAVPGVPRPRRPPMRTKAPRTPRVAELLSKAIKWRDLLDSGKIVSQAEIARREGVTRARVTQVMALLHLTHEIQQHVLALPDVTARPSITERTLRPITRIDDPRRQLAQFRELSLGNSMTPARRF